MLNSQPTHVGRQPTQENDVEQDVSSPRGKKRENDESVPYMIAPHHGKLELPLSALSPQATSCQTEST